MSAFSAMILKLRSSHGTYKSSTTSGLGSPENVAKMLRLHGRDKAVSTIQKTHTHKGMLAFSYLFSGVDFEFEPILVVFDMANPHLAL